mgnify:CR=1 FL=1
MAGEGQSYGSQISLVKFFRIFFDILKPEANFYWLAAVYGIGISLLSLATPISVQMLINTIANTALTAPLVMLSLTLFGLLFISSMLYALRVHLMEIFARRFYARMVAEISLISVYAQNPFFTDTTRGALFNRYFDVNTVQKAVPSLLIGGGRIETLTTEAVALSSGGNRRLIGAYALLQMLMPAMCLGWRLSRWRCEPGRCQGLRFWWCYYALAVL